MTALEGLVEDMPFDEYLAVEALSAGSARKLLPPSCPALFRQDQLTPFRSREMDVGHIAHSMVLEGHAFDDVALEVPGDWRTKAAKEHLADAEERGLVPLHTKDAEAVRGMAAGIRKNAMAAALFDQNTGRPEVSMFWTDERTGTKRKGRPDFMPERRRSGRLVIPDLKTTSGSADASEFGRTVVNFGYAQQLAGYEEGIRALGLDDDPVLLMVVQETRPPYLVNVLEVPAEGMAIARELNRWACQVYAECIEKNEWAGYPAEVQQVSLPSWWLRKFEEFAA